MTALVKNVSDRDAPNGAEGNIPVRGGFGLVPATKQTDQMRRAMMTMLLVLYPAMATAAVVITALVLSGAQPIV